MALDARGLVWADVRGLPREAPDRLLERGRRGLASPPEREGVDGAEAVSLRAGVAGVPVAAELAARTAFEGAPALRVPAEGERAFLASLPLGLLEPEPQLAGLLEGVGLATCGELAALTAEAVEVRFGPEGTRLWRLARADDPRRLFGPIPREPLHASLDFIDYSVTDPARLVFTANALLGGLCDRLHARGEHARRLTLTLPLGNGQVWRRTLRGARPTAARETWLRRVRSALERLTVSDAVVGVRLEVGTTEPAGVRQGDLFDRGFASAAAVEAAVARLMEEQGAVVVAPEVSAHPLPERRTRWRRREPHEVAETGSRSVSSASMVHGSDGGPESGAHPWRARLTLQLLPRPRRIAVETASERDHEAPRRCREGGRWQRVVQAAGPDRVSGGHWEEGAFAREYFSCVVEDGRLLWIYREAREGTWWLHGWWD